jgi:hypothetical protein
VVPRRLPPRLYHWTSASLLDDILQKGLLPDTRVRRGGHNRDKQVVFLQDEGDIEFAGTYFNLPTDPVRLTINTALLDGEWSPDLAAWNDWPGDPEDGLRGTMAKPSHFDTLHYTGCVCYHGAIPPQAILESLITPLPDHLAVF